jgi:hypothetical protein
LEVICVPTKFAAFIPVVRVAVHVVLFARLDDGINVTVAPFVLTAPLTRLLPSLSVKVSVVTVEPFTNVENVAETVVVTATFAAPFTGLVEITVRVTGAGVGSGGGAGAATQFVLLPPSVQLLGLIIVPDRLFESFTSI